MPEFTEHQIDAIDWKNQDACVVAGPGSGKTTVLVERYRSLVEQHGLDPRNILAITFTEKAAANMKAKLAELFAHDPLRLRDLESAYVSTIHGFCARTLRENAIAAGIDPRFTVLDARESDEMQYSSLNAALDELVELRREDALALIEAVQSPYFSGDLRSAYDGIRSAGKTVAEVRAMPGPAPQSDPPQTACRLRQLLSNWPAHLTEARRRQRAVLLEWSQLLGEAGGLEFEDFIKLIGACPLRLGSVPETEKEALTEFRESLHQLRASAVDRHTARFRAMIFDVLARFDEMYKERKTALGALDFNDLERRTVELLRGNEEVRSRIRAQFRQVMLDEFQDINEQQEALFKLVRGGDVFFAVGDVNQSIYGFRHARPDIFHEYEKHVRDSGKHSAKLLHNFRSRTEILRCVETLLNAAEGIDARELVAGTTFPPKQQPSIEVLVTHTGDDAEAKEESGAKEGRWIAHRILSLRGQLSLGSGETTRRADFGDFAVLCRTGDGMEPILEAFDHAGIPYVCGRRQSFLLSRIGLDITALLHTIANPRDGIALATVLRSTLVGIGDEALLRIKLVGGLNVLAHDRTKLAEFAPEDAEKLQRFIGDLKRWREQRPVTPLEILIVRALSDCGIEWAPGTVFGGNIESYLHLARTRGEARHFTEFLQEIESLQKAINLESDLSDRDLSTNNQGNCVQVMTTHAAKGLEFPVTIIAGMDKGTQRNSAPATFTPDFGLGLKWNDPGGKNGLEDSWQLRNAEDLKVREKQESNRLLYVAMTRAEEHLILSYTRGKHRPANWAKIVDNAFQLDSLAPASEPYMRQTPHFEIAVRVMDGEPPLLRVDDAAAAEADGVVTVPRPTIDDQHDSAVNVTSLTVFAACPRKYYIQRYIGWNGRRSSFDVEDLPTEDSGEQETNAAEMGSFVHEILAGAQGTFSPEAHRLANVFLESELGMRSRAAIRSEREWDFIVDVNGTLVRGTIDLWFEENGEIHIVDYKTNAVASSDYGPQLALYGLALERAFGKRPAHAWLHFLRPDKLVEVPLDDSAMANVTGLLTELREAQDRLRFDLHEGDHCRSCQFFRNLCPAAG
jgi:ATP-dependent helicase/nuclease subunit A